MEEKIKEIIAVFIKVPAGQIGPATTIGRSAVGSSILLHRMFARLAEAGWVGDNYSDIKVYADLWPAGPPVTGADLAPAFPAAGMTTAVSPLATVSSDRFPAADLAMPGVGIDMEEISAMPETPDFRSAEFYRMNFTPAEMAYCILQTDPYSSFAGLFAAKEAIVKADPQFRSRPFNTIAIDHTPEGKPVYPGFGLSVSHAGGMAVAIAVRGGIDFSYGPSYGPAGQHPISFQPVPPDRPAGSGTWIAWLALLLAVAALVIVLTH
jgi:phosphopantetheinyl transferase (holo-ACP synthase)